MCRGAADGDAEAAEIGGGGPGQGRARGSTSWWAMFRGNIRRGELAAAVGGSRRAAEVMPIRQTMPSAYGAIGHSPLAVNVISHREDGIRALDGVLDGRHPYEDVEEDEAGDGRWVVRGGKGGNWNPKGKTIVSNELKFSPIRNIYFLSSRLKT